MVHFGAWEGAVGDEVDEMVHLLAPKWAPPDLLGREGCSGAPVFGVLLFWRLLILAKGVWRLVVYFGAK